MGCDLPKQLRPTRRDLVLLLSPGLSDKNRLTEVSARLRS